MTRDGFQNLMRFKMKQLLLFPDMYDNMINDGINWIAPSKEEED